MPKLTSPSREDEILLRMLKTPPKPHAKMKIGKAKVGRAKGANRKPKKVKANYAELPPMKPFVAILVVVFSCGNAAADKIAISGDGTVSCATWVGRHQGYHDPNGAALSDWLFGYVTAVNQFASIPGNPPQPNDDALEAWVTNYCSQHPLDMLATAAARLILELRARAAATVPKR